VSNPFDPFGVGAMSAELWRAMMQNPNAAAETQAELSRALGEIALRASAAATDGGAPQAPLARPEANDRRFAADAWTTNPYFDALKQAYLLASKAVLESVDTAEGIDDATRRRIRFFTKQFLDAMSPSNVPWLNPEVLAETLRTGGANLQAGMRNALADMQQNEGRPSLVDDSAFTVGGNVATTPGHVVYRNELIELIEYAPTTAEVYARPLVIVPPWINKFYILDLQPANSFIAFARDAGRRTFVVSWRNPDASLRHLGWSDYLRLGPLTALRVAAQIAGTDDADLIGYCIGGTLSATLLAYLAKTNDTLVRTATFFAALVDFRDPGEVSAFLTEEGLATIDARMAEKGYLSGREMADTFNLLRANDLVWSVAVNRWFLGKDAPAFDLLYWNNDATRVPETCHRYYLRHMYVRNELVQADALEVDGVPIDLRRVTLPVYCVAAADDHIAPWRSVYAMTQLFGGETAFRLGASGHIAGIISPPGKKKAAWWGDPPGPPAPSSPDAWRERAAPHDGSWWPDWSAWLAERSAERVPAPTAPGAERYPPLGPAPGTYVLER
jgi:polyhydroxyalkanoate synthase